MSAEQEFILGEFRRALDERNRVAIPKSLADLLTVESSDCILAKERPGCISLWAAQVWQTRLKEEVSLIEHKMRAGRLRDEIAQVQLLGRLLSTRHENVPLDDRGRLLVPEGFREFLGVERGSEVMVVGAAVCVEIWSPAAWLKYLQGRMPKFRRLLSKLSK